jgi:hypothetical protein
MWPRLATFNREGDEGLTSAGQLYARSYLYMRLSIGLLGVALPAGLVALDWWFMTEDRQIRGSMSAYYHSPARDLFVAGLCVIGALLLNYMAAQLWTWDCLLSTAAGLALVVVAFAPTKRAGDGALCGDGDGIPPGCTALQQQFGELVVWRIHGIAAGIFTLLLAALCLVFALREYRLRRPIRPARIWLYGVSGATILVASAWALFGPTLAIFGYHWGQTYVGEVVAFGAFSMTWLTASFDLLRGLYVQVVHRSQQPPPVTAMAV